MDEFATTGQTYEEVLEIAKRYAGGLRYLVVSSAYDADVWQISLDLELGDLAPKLIGFEDYIDL